VAELSGTGLVADDLFLMAHDDVTGRPFLQPRAMGLGVAGGLLAELILAGRLWLARGMVAVDRASRSAEPLTGTVLEQVLGERERYPVGDWLAFLARTATDDVAVRLLRAGYLQRAWSRRLRQASQWIPVDPDCAFAALSRARPALDTAGSAAYSVTLAGLAIACGLGPRLLPYGPPDARHNLHLAVTQLVPSLQELICQCQAAVDKAVLAHRI
jgi:Golgi phosphoprotein 3 (GPP34)